MKAPEYIVGPLRAQLEANRGLHSEEPRAGLEATATAETLARVEALRTANPGLEAPPLHEPDPRPPQDVAATSANGASE